MDKRTGHSSSDTKIRVLIRDEDSWGHQCALVDARRARGDR